VIDGEVTSQGSTNHGAVLRCACIADWPERVRKSTGDHTRLMRGRQPRPRLPGRTADWNGMKHADLMTGPGGSMIILWRTDDVDGKHSARAPSEAPSRVPAAHRRPAPTEAVPVRPAATVKRRPAPGIARRPDISGARIGDPAAIPIGVEVSVLCNRGLPHLALPGNVVPASVGVQIGPPVALISRIIVARTRPV
jgi:hypothetical protein